MTNKTLGEKLQELREAAKYSVTQLGSLSGVPYQVINALENSDGVSASTSFANMCKLANSLEVSVAHFSEEPQPVAKGKNSELQKPTNISETEAAIIAKIVRYCEVAKVVASTPNCSGQCPLLVQYAKYLSDTIGDLYRCQTVDQTYLKLERGDPIEFQALLELHNLG